MIYGPVLLRRVIRWSNPLSWSRRFFQKRVIISKRRYKTPKHWRFQYRFNLKREHSLDGLLKMILDYKPGTLIDVGANIGQTLVKLLSIDSTRHYIGFEANLACAFTVEQFIAANALNHCRVVPLGLSSRPGSLELLMRTEEATASASLVKGFRPEGFYSVRKSVYVITGDSFIESLGVPAISLIKIDVEGAELEVIEGLRGSMRKYKPFIMFEVLPHYLVITNEGLDAKTTEFRNNRLRQLESIFREEAYVLFQIISKHHIQQIRTIEPGFEATLAASNYLAVPSGDEGAISSFLRDPDLCARLDSIS